MSLEILSPQTLQAVETFPGTEFAKYIYLTFFLKKIHRKAKASLKDLYL